MTTSASAQDGGPNGAPTASSDGTAIGDSPVETVYTAVEADSTLDVPMVVKHFNSKATPGDFEKDLAMGPSVVSSATSVWVSVSEWDPVTRKPISAVARTEIYDVCPQDGGLVRVTGRMFDFGSEIFIQFRALAI
ncbi:hypothetical protein ACFQ77_14270 [Streptomyces virginiae]|uniref:hypothetical protein n=1 Tax=Streptomyces virginiae TaxID=1961 RepID=UPI00369A93AD